MGFFDYLKSVFSADYKRSKYILRNPVLKSADDITEDLIQRIIDNNLDSLTIDFEFTKAPVLSELEWAGFRIDNSIPMTETMDSWLDTQYHNNPFVRADRQKPIKRIEFKVILTGNVKSLAGAFAYMTALEYVNLNDTSEITDMSFMFMCAGTFNQPVGNWNVSNVTDMSGMFLNAQSFNQPVGDWNVSKVKNMKAMFADATAFNQSLGNWDVSKVTDMSNMFAGALSFNQPIDNWDVSNVTDMSNMFARALSFNQPMDNWDVSDVTNMERMFYAAANFNQPVGNWNVSRVTDMSYMFCGAEKFNQPIGNWDVSNVRAMQYMFHGSDFHQDISGWKNQPSR